MARAVAHAGSSRPLIVIGDQLTLPIYTQIRLIEYHPDQIDRKIFPMICLASVSPMSSGEIQHRRFGMRVREAEFYLFEPVIEKSTDSIQIGIFEMLWLRTIV
jgi:hypothetical protein